MFFLTTLAYGAPAMCPARTAVALEALARTTGQARIVAAGCLLDRHPQAAHHAVESWMGDAEAADLVQLVIDRMDDLPESLAVAAASTGVRGPHARQVFPVVFASERPMVRAVLTIDDVDG